MVVKNTQYFLEKHYAAFDDPKPYSDEEPERKERIVVGDALLALHEQLYPFIRNQKWDLHQHHQKQHQISSFHFIIENGVPIVNNIGAMWLHYGKSLHQLRAYRTIGKTFKKDPSNYYDAFYNHTRIQFFINEKVFRSWLIFTDNNFYDRAEFRNNILLNPIKQGVVTVKN